MRTCWIREAFLVLLLGAAVGWPGHLEAARPAAPNCQNQDDKTAGFTPRAYSLSSMYVRAQVPEYSLLKGQWLLGQAVDTVPSGTCLDILEKKMIGVVQIWYSVQYRKGGQGQILRGWVWGGTQDVDDQRYIAGDRRPKAERPGEQGAVEGQDWKSAWNPFASIAYAQADVPPPTAGEPGEREATLPPPVQADTSASLVVIPFTNWAVSLASASAVVLFLVMVAGMVAKAVWDQTETGKGLLPSRDKIVRPFLVSPIAFSAFWGPMYVQQGSGGLSLTMALYAFQIGFMWQHVLEKRLGGETKEAKRPAGG